MKDKKSTQKQSKKKHSKQKKSKQKKSKQKKSKQKSFDYNINNQDNQNNNGNQNNQNNHSSHNKSKKTKFNIIMYSFYKQDDNTHTKDKNRCMCVDYDIKNQSFNMENNQDYRRCKNKSVKDTNFCHKHQNCMSYLKLFTNNEEPTGGMEEWNHPYIEGTHNCYSYMLNDKQESLKKKCHKICLKEKNNCPQKIGKCGNFKPQPGDYHLLMRDGNLKNKKRDYKCPKMEEKIMQDNKSVKKVGFFDKCPRNYYKGSMVVDPDHTFHFYRQNRDGGWSHKPGTMKVSEVDADNKKIAIPHFSNRDYSHKPNKIKYTDFCGYYCIPNNNYIETNSS